MVRSMSERIRVKSRHSRRFHTFALFVPTTIPATPNG